MCALLPQTTPFVNGGLSSRLYHVEHNVNVLIVSHNEHSVFTFSCHFLYQWKVLLWDEVMDIGLVPICIHSAYTEFTYILPTTEIAET